MSNTPDPVTLERCIADWEARIVPSEVPADDFGRQIVRNSYAGGFGAGVKLALRLVGQPDKVRDETLARFDAEVTEFLMRAQSAEGMPRA